MSEKILSCEECGHMIAEPQLLEHLETHVGPSYMRAAFLRCSCRFKATINELEAMMRHCATTGHSSDSVPMELNLLAAKEEYRLHEILRLGTQIHSNKLREDDQYFADLAANSSAKRNKRNYSLSLLDSVIEEPELSNTSSRRETHWMPDQTEHRSSAAGKRGLGQKPNPRRKTAPGNDGLDKSFDSTSYFFANPGFVPAKSYSNQRYCDGVHHRRSVLFPRDSFHETPNRTSAIQGFFTTLSDEFPANLAILDQIQALKWVQAEIHNFGGDPGQVTIFGESAGSTSVSVLTYSPLATGLFKGAIMESGTIYSPFALDGNGFVFFNSSKAFALETGCISEENWDSQNLKGLVNCLRKISWQKLHNVSQAAAKRIDVCCPWSPVVSGPVLPDWPRNLLNRRSTNISILLGTNNQEQYYYYAVPLLDGSLKLSDFSQSQFNDEVASEAVYWGRDALQVTKLVEYNYYGLRDPQLDPEDHLAWFQLSDEFQSGWWFFAATLREAQASRVSTPANNVFLYSFNYISDAYPWPTQNNISINGSYHGYELYFVFNMTKTFETLWGIPLWDFSPNDLNICEQFGIMWTNFAKTGNPNSPTKLKSEWKPLNNQNPSQYYAIDTNSRSERSYKQQSTQLWNNLIPTALGYHGPTFPPSPRTFGTLEPVTGRPIQHEPRKIFFIISWVVLGIGCLAILLAVLFLCFCRSGSQKNQVIDRTSLRLREFDTVEII